MIRPPLRRSRASTPTATIPTRPSATRQAAEARPAAQNAGAAQQVSLGKDAEDMAEIDRITVFPQDADAASPLLALVALRQGDVQKGCFDRRAARQARRPIRSFRICSGSVRLAQKCLPEAEAIFRDITKKQPEFSAASHNLAEVLVAENWPDEAKAVLQDLAQRTSQEQRAMMPTSLLARSCKLSRPEYQQTHTRYRQVA